MGGFSQVLICANSEQKSLQAKSKNREDFDLILTGQLRIHQLDAAWNRKKTLDQSCKHDPVAFCSNNVFVWLL